jgi:hypothetical protein
MNIQEKLKELNSCAEARIWARGKTWPEIYSTCDRGDWLCWLYSRSPGFDLKKMTLVKGLQAKQVAHLIKDKRSIEAVEAAIKFGEGLITRSQLDAAAATYAYAYATAYTAAFAYSANAAAARIRHLKKSANIFREHISIKDFGF